VLSLSRGNSGESLCVVLLDTVTPSEFVGR
jgi:hypothetical protein